MPDRFVGILLNEILRDDVVRDHVADLMAETPSMSEDVLDAGLQAAVDNAVEEYLS